MNSRPAVVSLCILSALLLSAFTAQSATAVSGTTAVTCEKGPGDLEGATFNEAHCKPSSPSGEWGHYRIDQDTTTELTGNDNGNGTKLKWVVGGLGITFNSTNLTLTGSMENRVDEGTGEHYIHGTGKIIYNGVTVSAAKCFVYTDDGTGTPGALGVVDTEELTATTTGQGAGLKTTPKVGNVLARFWILDINKKGAGGECNFLPGTYTVTGSVIATPNGATAVATHGATTAQNTLKMGKTGGEGLKAGIEGSLTLEGRAQGGGGYAPLSQVDAEEVTEVEEAEETKTKEHEEKELEATEHNKETADENGTTAVTCKDGPGDTGGPTFDTAHCLPGETAGNFGHYKIAENTTTELSMVAGGVATKLKSTIGGVGVTLTSTELTGTGSMENRLDEGSGEHYIDGTGKIVYNGVTVSVPKCLVYTDDGTGTAGAQGVVDTEELTATTTGQGAGLKITPKAGTVFARFWILDKNKKGAGGECNVPGTYVVTGSVIATPEGATVSTTHAQVTAQNTLKMGPTEAGAKAGIEGSMVLEGRAKGGGGYLPLNGTAPET